MRLTLFPRQPRSTSCSALLLGGLLALLITGCGSGIDGSKALVNTASSVALNPISGEDITGPCQFDLVLPNSSATQKGVLVFYERGDTHLLYEDQDVRSAALALNFALVWAHECNALSTGDLQSEASKGPARMLFTALTDLAVNSGHVELANAGVFLYGFSAAGVLASTMANERPDRIMGAVEYAAGSAYVDLDDVAISSKAAAIPTLVLANAVDRDSGTSRPYRYFLRGRSLGAPWAYAVQEKATHCCNLTTRSVVVPWIEAIVAGQATQVSASQSTASLAGSMTASFSCTPNGVRDDQGEVNCRFTKESLSQTGSMPAQSAWLPNAAAGAAWLSWVTNSSN